MTNIRYIMKKNKDSRRYKKKKADDFIDGVQNTKKNKKSIQRRAPFKQMLLKY